MIVNAERFASEWQQTDIICLLFIFTHVIRTRTRPDRTKHSRTDSVVLLRVWSERMRSNANCYIWIVKYFAKRYGTVSVGTCLTRVNYALKWIETNQFILHSHLKTKLAQYPERLNYPWYPNIFWCTYS